jgi:hypothetical protein
VKATKLITLALLTVLVLNASAKDFSSEELQQRMLERRAAEAVIWGMPIVSLDALRQAYFRDGKAKYGDIIWWPKGASWKNQSLTPNTSLRYLYVFFNTKDDGRWFWTYRRRRTGPASWAPSLMPGRCH